MGWKGRRGVGGQKSVGVPIFLSPTDFFKIYILGLNHTVSAELEERKNITGFSSNTDD